MSLDILTELTNYIKHAEESANNLRDQAKLALRRADEIDEKAGQATRDAIAIRDARNAHEARQVADLVAADQAARQGVLL